MKSFQLVCVFALVALAACGPVERKPKNPDAEVVIVPLEGQQDVFDLDDGVVDTGYPGPYFFNPFGNPFSGFMSGMDDMMKRLHDQMSQVMHRLPADNTEWKEIAEGKGNTTSTTKVINGHKVTVNETVYGDDGKDSGSFFKIRIVDVRPASEESGENSEEKVDNTHKELHTKEVEETTPRNVGENSSPELVEENNEIPRGKPENNLLDDDVATFGEDFQSEDLPEDTFFNSHMPMSQYLGLNDLDISVPLQEIESNDVNIEPIDLSNDININQMMADQGAPHNPDAETFNVNDKQKPYFQYNVADQQDPSFYMIQRR